MKCDTLRKCAFVVFCVCQLACSVLHPGPAATVNKFFNAMEAGNITDGVNLLSAQVRSQFGDEKVRSALAAQARDIKQQHRGIRSIATEKEDVQGELATVTVLITFADGTTRRDTEKLVRENGAWRITVNK